MTKTDADRFREQAEQCRLMAAKAVSPVGKEGWLKLASDWLKLAEDAEKRGQRRLL